MTQPECDRCGEPIDGEPITSVRTSGAVFDSYGCREDFEETRDNAA